MQAKPARCRDAIGERSTSTVAVCAAKRRDALLRLGLGLGSSLMMGAMQPAQARVEPINKEVDAADSPYIQELLRKTRENKERRDKERLQDYYKRNFKEYFQFESGDAQTGRARGINPETQQAIQRWLQENQ